MAAEFREPWEPPYRDYITAVSASKLLRVEAVWEQKPRLAKLQDCCG
jgi:hypothetical protein